MGQTLSEPDTKKEISACENPQYAVASCAMQGWRISMEDSHIHLLEAPGDESAAFFAVYDGHGGARVAQFAGMHLHKRIIRNDEYVNGDYESAIKSGFLKLDEDLRLDHDTQDEMSGATAVTVLIKDNVAYCGNVGDSRAVLCEKGQATPLSYDHKPNHENEMRRITAAGGWVDSGRINGNLALSRALGDFIFKGNEAMRPEEQIVIAFPDVVRLPITEDSEFILLACDGIWDVLSNEQAICFCRRRLAEGASPETVCTELVDHCLAPDCELSGVGCDNMTCVLVCLLRGQTKEEYVARLKAHPTPDMPELSEAERFQLHAEEMDETNDDALCASGSRPRMFDGNPELMEQVAEGFPNPFGLFSSLTKLASEGKDIKIGGAMPFTAATLQRILNDELGRGTKPEEENDEESDLSEANESANETKPDLTIEPDSPKSKDEHFTTPAESPRPQADDVKKAEDVKKATRNDEELPPADPQPSAAATTQ